MKGLEGSNNTSRKKTGAERAQNALRAAIATAIIGGAASAAEAKDISLPKPRPHIEQMLKKGTEKHMEEGAFRAFLAELKAVSQNVPLALRKLNQHWIDMSSDQMQAVEQLFNTRGVTFELALHAHSELPEYNVSSQDPALVYLGWVKRPLVAPLVINTQLSDSDWTELEEIARFQETLGNDKVKVVLAGLKIVLLRNLERTYKINPIELEQSAALVARNLHARGLPLTDLMIRQEVRTVQERRAQMSREPLLQGDTIVVTADEKMSEEKRRALAARGAKSFIPVGAPTFGSQLFRDSMKTATLQRPDAKFTDLNAATGERSPQEVKREILEMISLSQKPLTVFFNGHGDQFGNFYISTGVPVINGVVTIGHNAVFITPQEFADALVKRNNGNISIVFFSCYSQATIRLVADTLRTKGVPMPRLMMSSAELGQIGLYSAVNAYGGSFFELMATSPDVGTLLKKKNTIESAPTMFVPDKQEDGSEILMQLGGVVIPGANKVA